jgi:hypothetical protein
MARYMTVAADANKLLLSIRELLKDEFKDQGTEMLLRLFNYGIRVSPRGVQSTVRLNAVRRAAEETNVQVSMKEVKNARGYIYNALQLNGNLDTADESDE